ncbi:MAG TPA: cytochrome D1 domain-containing protein [Terracidiphilus sp.]|jgi:DNA-binding beta-propeller fold protein YncE|nr:cytochrome D1 domain-containing protein [Terracidiphilus sp.]
MHPARVVLLFAFVAPSVFAQSPRLLVAQKGEASLGIVDPVSGKLIAAVPEGGFTGHEVVASRDGKLAFVPIYGNSGVGKPGTDGRNLAVIDIASQKIVGNVDFGHGVRPHDPVLGPKDGLLYVTTELDKTITLIDPRTLKIVGSIPTGQAESHMLALSHDGRRGYTANVGPGTVSVLDIAARKMLAVIPVSSNTQRISITPDDKWVFTADQTRPQLAAIDTASNKVAHWIPLEGIAYGTAPTLDGRYLVVTIPAKSEVAVVDLMTMQVVRSVQTPADPEEVLMRPGGKVTYVSCVASRQIAEIDLGTWKVIRTIQDGRNSDGIAWAGSR